MPYPYRYRVQSKSTIALTSPFPPHSHISLLKSCNLGANSSACTSFSPIDPRQIIHRRLPSALQVDRPSFMLELCQPAIKVTTCGTLDQVNILADFQLSCDRSYVPNHICPLPNRPHRFPQKPTRSSANPLGASRATETLPGTHF